MNVYTHYRAQILDALGALAADGTLPDGLDTKNVAVEPPRDASHGDLAVNAAMVLAKAAKMKPRDIADALAPKIEAMADVAAVEIAGPGFINIRLADSFWTGQVATVLKAGVDYGTGIAADDKPINVEYVSANPTGPMHVGHCRGAVFGDALAALLEKAGHEVHREYYINDAGVQIDVLARSAHLRYREALGEAIGEIPEGLYPGDYLVPIGAKLAADHGNSLIEMDEQGWLPIVRPFVVREMMALIADDLKALGITFDTYFSEKTLHEDGRIGEAVKALEDQGLIYEGVLEPPKGKLPDDWEERPQTLFRAADFGDDTDRPLKKSDGAWTYFAADIAYHYDKFKRGYTHQIDVWGADHGGYVKRMKAALAAVSGQEADLDVKLCQLVHLYRDGEPVRMSKRAGTFVTLRDVVDEVGKDVVRFIMLTRKNDAPLDFDFAKVMEQSKDNPVFYVQYAHARICSVLRNAPDSWADLDLGDAALAEAELSVLSDAEELKLIRQMAMWPRLVEQAAAAHEPHRISFYLNDLATAFHQLWNAGKDRPELRFILAEGEHENARSVTLARLALIRAVSLVIASGLAILGVTPVEEMR
ncbi:MAG: arginine--tRNA ligase [Alphaproteobacteria bacterium]